MERPEAATETQRQAQATIRVSVTFDALKDAIRQLCLEDKLRLAAELDEQILEEEDRTLEPDPEEEARVAQARRDYEAGDYVTFDQYDAERRGRT